MRDLLKEREQKVLDFVLSNEYRKMTVKQIAAIFDVPKKEFKDLESIINKLEEEGKVYIDESKRVCLPDFISRFVCVFEAKSKGFGFARVLNDNVNVHDIYISKDNMNNAFDNDVILVDVIKPETGLINPIPKTSADGVLVFIILSPL